MRTGLGLTLIAAALMGSAASVQAQVPVSVPYTIDFDAFPTCSTVAGNPCLLPAMSGWLNDTNDDIDWTVRVGSTGSSNTGPSGDHTSGSGNYLYTESSSGGFPMKVAELLSPVINLSGVSTLGIQFWYHMYGATMGTMHVDLIEDPNGTPNRINDIIPAWTDNVDRWQQSRLILLNTSASEVRIVIRGITGTSFTSDMSIDDFSARSVGANDIALTDVSLRGFPCAGTNAVVARVANVGTATQSNIPLQYSVSGGATVMETFAGPLGPGQVATHTFMDTVFPVGNATINASAMLASDQDSSNDAASHMVFNKRTVSTFPYNENFEAAGAADWSASGANSSWALGTPGGPVITQANSGTNAWATGSGGTYNNNERSFVTGPCFDFSGVQNPRLSFPVWWQSELSWDGALVQTSTTSGRTWTTIGAVGDPNNWYNDATISGLGTIDPAQNGWSGTGASGLTNYVTAAHDMNGTGGVSTVLVRVAFGSDGSVVDEGFAFDDVSIVDNPPRFEVSNIPFAPPVDSVQGGSTDVVVQALRLDAVLRGQTLTSVTVTRRGTLTDAEIAGVRLLLDDGDGLFEPNQDTVLSSTQTFSGGQATFSAMPLAAVPAGQSILWVTYDIAMSAAGGRTFGASIEASTDVAIMGSDPVTLAMNMPARGRLLHTFSAINILPYTDNFDGLQAPNRTSTSGPAIFPTATATGAMVMASMRTLNPGRVGLTERVTGGANMIVPTSTPTMAVLIFVTGQATSALDYHFDLSSYNATTDDLWFEFEWNNIFAIDNPEDNVFISLDGGATWALSLYHFAAVPTGWNHVAVPMSAALNAAGLNYTSNVVIRFQAAGLNEAITLDDLWAGVPQRLRVERVMGMPIASGGNDNVGMIQGLTPATAVYTIHNDGDRPMLINPMSIMGLMPMNATFTSATLASNAPIPPNSSTMLTVNYIAPGAGPFSFNLTFQTDDPHLPMGVYSVNINGISQLQPEIDWLNGMMSIPNAGMDALGAARAGAMHMVTYTLANGGNGPLALTTTVTVSGTMNVAAVVMNPPPSSIGPRTNAMFTVVYTPAATGPFGFTLSVGNDDMDENPYVVRASGTAVAPELAVARGGMDIANTSTDTAGVLETGMAATLTYTVANSGTDALNFTNMPPVALSNLVNTMAAVTTQPTNPLAASGMSTFTIDVTPTATGSISFDVSLANDDADEGGFGFSVTGTGFTPVPEIEVEQGGTALANNASDDGGNHMPKAAQMRTYTIRNTGTATLTLSGVGIAGPMNVTASVSKSPAMALAPGASDTAEITYSADATGAYSFDVVISSNDADEGTYTIKVSGMGDVLAPEIDVQQPAGTSLASGSTVMVGEVDVGAAQTFTFTVENQGVGPLNLSGTPPVSIGALNNATGEVTTQPDAMLAPAATATFTVSIKASAAGAFSGTISIASDDGDEATYTIVLGGTGKAMTVSGGPGDGEKPTEEEGCSCTVATHPSNSSSPLAIVGLALLGLALRRRRR